MPKVDFISLSPGQNFGNYKGFKKTWILINFNSW